MSKFYSVFQVKIHLIISICLIFAYKKIATRNNFFFSISSNEFIYHIRHNLIQNIIIRNFMSAG